jgi:hypothetical protein
MEFLKYLFIRLTSKDSQTAIDTYVKLHSEPTIIFRNKTNHKPKRKVKYITKEVEKIVYVTTPSEPIKTSSKPIDKKEELLESLEFLRKKQYKTKQDKESIQIINSILKNMK